MGESTTGTEEKEAPGLYLTPDAAAGCRYALDPDSPALRGALTRRPPSGDAALDAAALAADLALLHRLLRQHYAGYPDLLQHPTFDPEAFFAAWIGRVATGGAGTTFRERVVEPLVALRLVHPDGHLTVEGAGPLLAAEPPPGPRFDPGVRRGGATDPYPGRVVALVDRHSGSSGELAALELRRALGAILVGERTAGTMQYGQLQRFVLPRTGLVWQVPTRRFFFEEEVEGVGLPVDAYLERIDTDPAALVPWLERAGDGPAPVRA